MASQSWIDKDFYAILGVGKTASADEVKKAYRRLAKELHPDRNATKEAEERFKEIGEAYAVLSDASKRAEYDKLRDAIASGVPGGGGGRGFNVSDFGFGEEFDVEELLRQIFGGAATGRGGVRFDFGGPGGFAGFGGPFGGRPARGRDVETDVRLSFGEAAAGTERTIRTDFGSGPKDVTVRIPAGVADGARIRVRSRGEPGGDGGPAGDLFVRTRVDKHPIFDRKGRDLTLTLPITFPEAALGAEVKVPTLDGPVTLKIPAGTSSGRTFRLRGRGITFNDGTKGDILATVQVAVPQKLSKTQKELIEQLAQDDPSPRDDLGV